MSVDRDYEEEDIYYIYKQDGFESWEDIICWLRDEGQKRTELENAKINDLIYDFETVRNRGTDFTNNPEEAFHLLLENRLE